MTRVLNMDVFADLPVYREAVVDEELFAGGSP